jgi:hypothetical protein
MKKEKKRRVKTNDGFLSFFSRKAAVSYRISPQLIMVLPVGKVPATIWLMAKIEETRYWWLIDIDPSMRSGASV